MHRKSCFFIGHRETGEEILPALIDTIETLIVENEVKEFVVGYYGGFDRMAASALCSLKKQYHDIYLLLLTPYHPAERAVKLPTGFDSAFYPPGLENVPKRFAIIKANQYMIDNSDYLVSYVWHTASNSKNLIEYAKRRGIKIINLAQSKN